MTDTQNTYIFYSVTYREFPLKNTNPALVLKSLRKDFDSVRKDALSRERKEQELRTARLAAGRTVTYRL